MDKLMKFVAVAAAGVALTASLPDQADAGGARKKRMRVAEYSKPLEAGTRGYRNPMAENGYNGYYERVLEKVPFGSPIWWRVWESYPKGR